MSLSICPLAKQSVSLANFLPSFLAFFTSNFLFLLYFALSLFYGHYLFHLSFVCLFINLFPLAIIVSVSISHLLFLIQIPFIGLASLQMMSVLFPCVVQPATVSRCGMVYLEPITLGWRPLVKSWLQVYPQVLGEECKELTHVMFEWLVDPCLDFVRKNCKVGRLLAFVSF